MVLWIAHDPDHFCHVFTKIFKVFVVEILVSFMEEIEDVFVFLIWIKVCEILILRLEETLHTIADMFVSKEVI